MEHIIDIITAIIAIASIIAAVTPTPKDNVWLEKAMKFVNLLAVNVGNATNQK
tara:strand:+ start:170 stop:328 length:159 start_codon:yes stop_codon:yes gene_type:complete